MLLIIGSLSRYGFHWSFNHVHMLKSTQSDSGCASFFVVAVLLTLTLCTFVYWRDVFVKPPIDNDNNLLLWRAETYPHIRRENGCHCGAESTCVIVCGRELRSGIAASDILNFHFFWQKSKEVSFFWDRGTRRTSSPLNGCSAAGSQWCEA